jgi:hypothetical protein
MKRQRHFNFALRPTSHAFPPFARSEFAAIAPPPPLRSHQTVVGLAPTSEPEGRTGHRAKYTKKGIKNNLLSFVNFYLAFLIRRE